MGLTKRTIPETITTLKKSINQSINQSIYSVMHLVKKNKVQCSVVKRYLRNLLYFNLIKIQQIMTKMTEI